MTRKNRAPVGEVPPLDVAALQHELHAKQGKNRQDRRAASRTAAANEAAGFARVTSHPHRSRPVGGAS